jgi:hypothetical protein
MAFIIIDPKLLTTGGSGLVKTWAWPLAFGTRDFAYSIRIKYE